MRILHTLFCAFCHFAHSFSSYLLDLYFILENQQLRLHWLALCRFSTRDWKQSLCPWTCGFITWTTSSLSTPMILTSSDSSSSGVWTLVDWSSGRSLYTFHSIAAFYFFYFSTMLSLIFFYVYLNNFIYCDLVNLILSTVLIHSAQVFIRR